MNQTPMTTPPSRQSTNRVANTLTSLWVDTLPDTVLNNNSCYKYLKKQNKKAMRLTTRKEYYAERTNNYKE